MPRSAALRLRRAAAAVTRAAVSRACAPLVEALEGRRLLANAAPVMTDADLPPLIPIVEGSSYALSGKFTDPDVGDAHTVTVDWGDGSDPQTVSVSAGARTF